MPAHAAWGVREKLVGKCRGLSRTTEPERDEHRVAEGDALVLGILAFPRSADRGFSIGACARVIAPGETDPRAVPDFSTRRAWRSAREFSTSRMRGTTRSAPRVCPL